ncbi:hypothetical protein, partial [Enterococcus faecium]|uniref:hypothetical protein n=1 Tax=Enterococcus faecium TaxID=1352 RepID=UPI003CC594CB
LHAATSNLLDLFLLSWVITLQLARDLFSHTRIPRLNGFHDFYRRIEPVPPDPFQNLHLS